MVVQYELSGTTSATGLNPSVMNCSNSDNRNTETNETVKPACKQYEIARRNREVLPEPVCSRCEMTAEEHKELGLSMLQLHHVVALKDGGHPIDPSSLITLCKFCHDWWHKYCEPFGRAWSANLNSEYAYSILKSRYFQFGLKLHQ